MVINPLRSARWAAVVLVLAASSVSIQAQGMKERELKPAVDFAAMQMPIEIVSIKLNGKEVRSGEKIQGNDDWLRGASFTLKNVSDKAIAYVAIGFKFTLPKRIVVYILSYGVDLSRGDHRRDSSPPAIQPGDSLDLVITKEQYEVFLSLLERGGVSPRFDVAPYFIDRISFENEPDVIWEAGSLKLRNPAELGRFDFVERYVLPTRQK
jgi:hypothetical protein